MKFTLNNYYEILNTSIDATDEEIKLSYSQIKSFWKPDSIAVYSLYDSEESEIIQHKIEEAYIILSNKEKRNTYNQYLNSLQQLSKQKAKSFSPDTFWNIVHDDIFLKKEQESNYFINVISSIIKKYDGTNNNIGYNNEDLEEDRLAVGYTRSSQNDMKIINENTTHSHYLNTAKHTNKHTSNENLQNTTEILNYSTQLLVDKDKSNFNTKYTYDIISKNNQKNHYDKPQNKFNASQKISKKHNNHIPIEKENSSSFTSASSLYSNSLNNKNIYLESKHVYIKSQIPEGRVEVPNLKNQLVHFNTLNASTKNNEENIELIIEAEDSTDFQAEKESCGLSLKNSLDIPEIFDNDNSKKEHQIELKNVNANTNDNTNHASNILPFKQNSAPHFEFENTNTSNQYCTPYNEDLKKELSETTSNSATSNSVINEDSIRFQEHIKDNQASSNHTSNQLDNDNTNPGWTRSFSRAIKPSRPIPNKAVPSDLLNDWIEEHGFGGYLLKLIREHKGITLNDLTEHTKIQSTYLSYIESEQFEDLPPAVYIEGFVKQYTRLLKLDSEWLTQNYMTRYNDIMQSRRPTNKK